jgi:predicted adenylyl cyclase CyaB
MHKTVIEIKARCEDHAAIRKILESQNARHIGKDHQIDTYFRVNKGRLKLREGHIENHLIFYDREDKRGPKRSSVQLFKTEPKSSLKFILTEALGILAVVEKQRDIYFIDDIKFHLDKVKGLGFFVEIESMGDKPESQLLEECRHYLVLFKISENDLISGSYSDMILAG